MTAAMAWRGKRRAMNSVQIKAPLLNPSPRRGVFVAKRACAISAPSAELTTNIFVMDCQRIVTAYSPRKTGGTPTFCKAGYTSIDQPLLLCEYYILETSAIPKRRKECVKDFDWVSDKLPSTQDPIAGPKSADNRNKFVLSLPSRPMPLVPPIWQKLLSRSDYCD